MQTVKNDDWVEDFIALSELPDEAVAIAHNVIEESQNTQEVISRLDRNKQWLELIGANEVGYARKVDLVVRCFEHQ